MLQLGNRGESETLWTQGVTPPFPLYEAAEAHLIADYLVDSHHPKPEWFKGRAACKPLMLARNCRLQA
jgi:hypothetical protein